MMSEYDEFDEFESERCPRMGWLTTTVLWACAFFGMWYFFRQRDFLGTASVFIVVLMGFAGFRYGFGKMLAKIGGLIAASYFAPMLAIPQEAQVAERLGTTGLLNRILCVGVTWLVLLVVVTYIINAIQSWLVSNRPKMEYSNAWLGFGAGATQAALAILLVIGGLFVVEPSIRARSNAESLAEATWGKRIADTALVVVEESHQSVLSPKIKEYNPFLKFPSLNRFDEVQQSIEVINDPTRLQTVLEHPEMKEIESQEEVQQALAELNEDESIADLLESGSALDWNTAYQLLKHPAILRLVDHPEFVARVSRVLADSRATLESPQDSGGASDSESSIDETEMRDFMKAALQDHLEEAVDSLPLAAGE